MILQTKDNPYGLTDHVQLWKRGLMMTVITRKEATCWLINGLYRQINDQAIEWIETTV